MTYNQVQSFQINDYVNHYVDIEITGYRALYSKSIACRGVAGLIHWLGTAGPVDCFNKSVFDCYIRVYQSFWKGTANFWLGLLLATPLKCGTQLIFKILEVYLRDHARQLEYSNLRQIRLYFSSLSILKQASSKLLPKIIYCQAHMGFTMDNIVSLVTYPIRRNKLLKMHNRRSQK